ncbi:hypothetical protein BM1_01743 [Bipolaris maydis]|nr:hypothetical protein BM1_01743 [Bipolaris maydis]
MWPPARPSDARQLETTDRRDPGHTTKTAAGRAHDEGRTRPQAHGDEHVDEADEGLMAAPGTCLFFGRLEARSVADGRRPAPGYTSIMASHSTRRHTGTWTHGDMVGASMLPVVSQRGAGTQREQCSSGGYGAAEAQGRTEARRVRPTTSIQQSDGQTDEVCIGLGRQREACGEG